ncbi:hypothetical protein ACOZ38_25515 [Sphaerisporangium viridialbum]|uniref:hypothetical protein n=1 Tax=Sphaerisporangium viridialbum TaxID=46189 RepID=UPI003C7563F8
MSNGIVRWEDPPPLTQYNDNDLDDIATLLRDNPGKWAVVKERPADAEGRREIARVFAVVKYGRRNFVADDKGKFTATMRTVKTGDDQKTIRLHARYDRR